MSTPKNDTPLACVILAAGKGTRMKSNRPKVMHELAGRPIIQWLVSAVEELQPDKIITVVGPDMDDVAAAVAPHETAVQEKRLGTGDAVKAALPALKGFDGDVVILLGDAPLITASTLQSLINARHAQNETGLSVLGTHLENPTGYGRLIIGAESSLQKIVEEKDASEEEKNYTLVNTGAFCVRGEKLEKWISKLDDDNAQKEYYITDLPLIAAQDGFKTRVHVCSDPDEVKGINSRTQLAALEDIIQNRLRIQAMENGATLRDPATVYFAHDTKIGRDVVIGQHVVFGPDVQIADNVTIHPYCHLEGVKVDEYASIGPFARLRPGTSLEQGVKIGNFVEIKNTHMGEGAKANHLAYIGDADVGRKVNFSAGAITVNYDGYEKHKTIIGDGAMVGCNANLVAPVEIGDGAYVAAGSTITEDVPKDALSVARNRPIIRDQWAAKRRKNRTKA